MLLKTAIRLLLFRKAGEQLGLFDVPVPVKPYVRNGKVVPGHVATRKKRLAPKGKQPDLFGAAAPKDETVRLGRLGHFIDKHGGYRRLLSLLASFSPAQKDTLLASMAKLAGKSPAAILDILKTGARHEGPAAKQDDLFSEPSQDARPDGANAWLMTGYEKSEAEEELPSVEPGEGGVSTGSTRVGPTTPRPGKGAEGKSSVVNGAEDSKSPQEGERNAEGLVFRDGRWRREDSPEARTAAIDDMLDAEEAQRGTLQKAFGLLAA